MRHLFLKTYIRKQLKQGICRYLVRLVIPDSLNIAFCPISTAFDIQTGTSHQRHSRDPTKAPELDIVIAKIHSVRGSEDEILSYLVQDDVCDAITLSHTLVQKLLLRFKDDWKSALGAFRWAGSHPGFEHSPDSYDLMVDILGKARQFDKMKELVDEMGRGKMVSLNTVAKLMRRFAGADRWDDTIRVFDELGTFGLKRNSDSMNLLLDTLCKENEVDRAREVFLELKSHIEPNAHTFNIFIHGWCKVNRVEEALWTIQEMKAHGFHPCVISYSTIIQSYCNQSNYVRVYELLDEMESRECQPNVVTYTAVMSSLTKSEQFEEALKIAERVKSVGCKPDTLFYNALIHTLGRARKFREALDVFETDMPRNGINPNTSTYNTMIAMFCRHGQEQKAFKFLRDMEKKQLCKPDLQTFYPLLKSCFKTGKIDGVLSELLERMAEEHHLSLDVSTYTLLIHNLCRLNRCEWAYCLFEEMIRKEIRPRSQTCRLLLDEIKKTTMCDAADKVELYMKQMKAWR